MLSSTNRLGWFGAAPKSVIQSATLRFGAFAAGLMLLAGGSASMASETPLETTLSSSALMPVDHSSRPRASSIALADGDSAEEQIFQGDLISARSVTDFSRNAQPFGVLNGQLDVFSGVASLQPLSLNGQGLSATIADLHDHRPLHSVPLRANAEAASSGQLRSIRPEFAFDENAAAVTAATAQSPGNVLIPVPSAALSGLSVLGGLGIFAGIRRAIRGLR